jgi:hypothetical protein
MYEEINTNAPITTIPLSCAIIVTSGLKIPTASVPQIPATK